MATAIPFLRNVQRVPYSNLANIYRAFLHDPTLTQSVWYDTFLDRVLTGSPAREWAEADDSRAAVYLQETHNLKHVTSRQVQEIVNSYARFTPQHVVRDWLATLVWDRVPRIAEAFCDYWDATPSASQPHEYLRAISRNFFVGLIARVMHPGCQLDEMVVFEGAQGIGKTSALRVLGGAWYAAAHERVTAKDFFQDLQGKWLVEISELSAFSRAEVERIKSAISTQNDRFRNSYARRSSDHPRQCVFAGTTNRTDWGLDETGLRRFWPVTVGAVDLSALTAAREALFAEALAVLTASRTWWHVPACAVDVQTDRHPYDEWTELVLPYAQRLITSGVPYVRISEILENCLKIYPSQSEKKHEMRIAAILVLAGWTRKLLRHHGFPTRVWYPPVTTSPTVTTSS